MPDKIFFLSGTPRKKGIVDLKKDIRKEIEAELGKRHKTIVNKNAIDAFLSYIAPPIQALRQVFFGRKDAMDAERQKITIEMLLQLVIETDDAISDNNGKIEGINWEDVGYVLTGVTCGHCKSSFGVIACVGGGKLKCPVCTIGWTVVNGKIEAYGEDAEEVTGMDISSDAGPVELKPGTHIKASGKNVGNITGLRIGGNPSGKGND